MPEGVSLHDSYIVSLWACDPGLCLNLVNYQPTWITRLYLCSAPRCRFGRQLTSFWATAENPALCLTYMLVCVRSHFQIPFATHASHVVFCSSKSGSYRSSCWQKIRAISGIIRSIPEVSNRRCRAAERNSGDWKIQNHRWSTRTQSGHNCVLALR